jgi:hypothetical protein
VGAVLLVHDISHFLEEAVAATGQRAPEAAERALASVKRLEVHLARKQTLVPLGPGSAGVDRKQAE